MQPISHFEVYEARAGQWALVSRFSGVDRDRALAEAHEIEGRGVPIAVIEEIDDMAEARIELRIAQRSGVAAGLLAPPNHSEIGSRIFMVILNSLAIGAIVAVLIAMLLSGAGNSEVIRFVGPPVFLGSALVSGLMLFHIYLPLSVIVWGTKDPEARDRVIKLLRSGRPVVTNMAGSPVATNAAGSSIAAVPAPAAPTTQPPPDPAMPPPPALGTDSAALTTAAPEIAAADPEVAAANPTLSLEAVQGTVAAFIDATMTDLRIVRPTFSARDYFPFGLFVAGAVEAMVQGNQLGTDDARKVLEGALRQSGLADDDVADFLREWGEDDARPRFRRMMDEGRAALAMHLGEPSPLDHLSLAQLISRWHDAGTAAANERHDVTLLLTDIVGSTALTSQIGNAGAQRVVRAHNTIVRAAAKAFRGREVKHTGDGMLLAFPDAGAAARAAVDIQQETCEFAEANPAAPLSLRIGLHTGEALLEDGEYYGPAVATVNGICAQASANEIACTGALRRKLPGAMKVEDLGQVTLKGGTERVGAFKLLWEPKRAKTKSVLEYRQIGTAPAPGGVLGPR